MRRPPPALLILAPLLLALLYALVYRLAAPTPTVATVVPAEAIYVQRYRDIEALDETFFRHPDDPNSPAERISVGLNIEGFPGLDRRRPVHLVFLPRGLLPDSTMFILPLVREEALRARFEDPSFFLDRGHVRRAKYLSVRGDFAAIGGDPDAVEHLGESGLTAESLGETFAMAVDVPGLVDYAAQTPWERPWAPMFSALGVGEDDIESLDGVVALTSDRVARLRGAWRTARLWSFVEEKRLRIELEPSAGPLADALRELVAAEAPTEEASLPTPRRAQAWIHLPGARERAVFARSLHDAGVAFPPGLGGGADGPGPWSDAARGGGLLLWASASPGLGYAWTVGVAAWPGDLLDLSPFLPGHPTLEGEGGALDADLPAEEGTLPLTLADLTLDRTAPKGRIVARRVGGLDVVLAGPSPDRARVDLERGLAEGRNRPRPEPPAPPWRRVLRFGLEGARARTLLGNELKRGGLFAGLAGGGLEGTVTTDGRILRLDVQVVDPR